uniref:Uncharacterized protein n=1 Tax=Neogobius melanostomus TaxID=47308 RepID=A0A8C6T9N9_9GOBI
SRIKPDCYPFKSHKDALVFRRVQRRFRLRYVFKKFKEYVALCRQKDPQEALRPVNPGEAKLLDSASGATLRFKLAGEVFPPVVQYKIYTYRPIIDVGAFSPGNFTKPSNRQKVQQTKKSPTKTNQKKPNERVENNGWRVFRDFIKHREKIDTDPDIKKIIFRHSKLLRQQDKERRMKGIQIKWLKKMLVDDQFEELMRTMGIVDLKVDELMQWFEKNPDDVEDWLLNEWIAWANVLPLRIQNYEEYKNSWDNSGYSLPSELTIGPNHRNYDPFGQ